MRLNPILHVGGVQVAITLAPPALVVVMLPAVLAPTVAGLRRTPGERHPSDGVARRINHGRG